MADSDGNKVSKEFEETLTALPRRKIPENALAAANNDQPAPNKDRELEEIQGRVKPKDFMDSFLHNFDKEETKERAEQDKVAKDSMVVFFEHLQGKPRIVMSEADLRLRQEYIAASRKTTPPKRSNYSGAPSRAADWPFIHPNGANLMFATKPRDNSLLLSEGPTSEQKYLHEELTVVEPQPTTQHDEKRPDYYEIAAGRAQDLD
jgi:hypothetical protein